MPATTARQGDTVVITEGPIAGLEAAYQMADAEQRAMVLLHILSQPVPVKIDAASLRTRVRHQMLYAQAQ